MGFAGDGAHRFGLEFQAHAVHRQQGLELLDQRIARLGEDRFEGLLIEGLEHRTNRDPADEFGDQAVLHQIVRFQVAQHLAGLLILLTGAAVAGFTRDKADGIAAHAALDHVIESHKGTTADEQDLAGIDLDAVLVGMLAAALGGNVGHGAFQHLQQGLLDTFSRDVAGD